jgi:hypothetical protein
VSLKQVRKEGSKYDCYSIGRISGQVDLTGQLKIFRAKIGKGRQQATWLAPWSMHFTSEIDRNDGEYLEESRTFHEVRFLRALTPPNLTKLDYRLEPWLNSALSKAAATLVTTPGPVESPIAIGAMALIAGQKHDYANLAKILGLDESALNLQADPVFATAAIVDEFEGQTVTMSAKDGRVRWFTSPDASAAVVDTMKRAATPIDYNPITSIELAIGEQTTISNQVINNMIPPELRKDVFDNNDLTLDLNLTRVADRSEGNRSFAIMTGTGKIHFRSASGKSKLSAEVSEARIEIDGSDPESRYLHLLELTVPLEASAVTSSSYFHDVSFDGDLLLNLRYTVDQIK